MLCRQTYRLSVLLVVVAVALAVCRRSEAGLWDCMFGGVQSQTTYAPAFAPAYAAPAPVAVPVCPPMAAPACTPCVTQTCGYMPTAVYRALYQPTVVAAYRPVFGYSAYTGYAVTSTYRPLLGTYQTRLVPYAAYYPPAAFSYSAYYAPYCPPCTSCSPCASFSSPCSGSSPCPSGACGSPAPAVSAPMTYAPAPARSDIAPSLPLNGAAPQGNSAPSTFQEQRNRPASEAEVQPIPQPDAKLNSMPAPALPDPNARTADRSSHTSVRAQLAAQSAAVQDDGWRPARD